MVTIRTIREAQDVEAAAALFVASLSPGYISHSELMYGRATAPGTWAPDIAARAAHEFGALAAADETALDGRILLGAYDGDDLIGCAILAWEGSAEGSFGTLEDVVVAPDARRRGVLSTLLDACESRLRERGIGQIFLESGKGNDGAHHAFERLGFAPVSVVMRKALD